MRQAESIKNGGMLKMKINYPKDLIPENVNVLVERLQDKDNRKVGRAAKKEEDKGEFKPGLIKAVKKAIQTENKDNAGEAESKVRENMIREAVKGMKFDSGK